MTGHTAPRPDRDAIYRLIQWVMLSDVLIGIVLMAVGAFILDARAMVIAGAGLAVIGAAMFFFFRLLARRARDTATPSPRSSPHDLRR